MEGASFFWSLPSNPSKSCVTFFLRLKKKELKSSCKISLHLTGF